MSVQVIARARPLKAQEKGCLSYGQDASITAGDLEFQFDRVLREDATQEETFKVSFWSTHHFTGFAASRS